MMLIKELKLSFFTEEYSRSMTSKLPFFYRKRTAADVGLIPIGSRLSSEMSISSIPHSKSVFSTASLNSLSAIHSYKTLLLVIAILHELEIFTKY